MAQQTLNDGVSFGEQRSKINSNFTELYSTKTTNSNAAITGGSITGITDLAVADGGTGASDAAGARTNLGLGSISTQNSTSVNIDGGSIDGTAIGGSTPASGAFTTLSVQGYRTLSSDGNGVYTHLSQSDLGWAAAYGVKSSDGSVSLSQFGATGGTNTSAEYSYVAAQGQDYASATMKVYPDSVGVNGSLSASGQIMGKGASSVDSNAAFESDSGASVTAYHAQNNGGYGAFFGYDNGRYAGGAAMVRNIANTPLIFETNNTERMRLDSSGNLGLGVTPSAWGSAALEFPNGVGLGNFTGTMNLTQNAYSSAASGSWKYKATAAATLYQQQTGVHYWYTAPSGTAGNAISFIQAMTLDANSKLAVLGELSSSNNNFRVASNGNVTNLNNSYGAISDIKLKQDIEDCSPKLEKLNQVRIVNYRLKTDPEFKQLGVIAQELEQIFPGLVEETEDYKEVTKTREVPVPAVTEEQLVTEAVFNADGEEVEPAVYKTVEIKPATTKTEEYTEQVPTGEFTKSVKYSVFVPMLIKAVQEQSSIINSLEDRIAKLEELLLKENQ